MTRTHKEYTTGREAVYGWYPPQYNVYVNNRNQQDYAKECLFRHSQSQYTDRRMVDSPSSPVLSIQGSKVQPGRASVTSRPPSGQRQSSPVRRRSSATPVRKPPTPNRLRTPIAPSGTIPTPNFQYIPPEYRPHAPTPDLGKRTPSPARAFRATPDGRSSVKKNHGWVTQATPIITDQSQGQTDDNNNNYPMTPHVHFKSAMEFYTPRREYTTPQPKTNENDVKQSAGTHPFADEDFYDPVSSPEVHVKTPEGMRDSPASETRSMGSVTRPRIQSATMRRAKTPHPKRPVKSAGLTRTRPPTASPEEPEIVRVFSTMEVGAKTPTPSFNDQGRPQQPVPQSPVTSLTPAATPIVQERCKTPEYEDLLDTYGWRVEVHGDPLGIKQVPSRLPYTVKCDDPVIPKNPPKHHMENYDTYFYNTIPRNRATFEVHKEWASEVLLDKRRESQKRTGQSYRTKNYAFIY